MVLIFNIMKFKTNYKFKELILLWTKEERSNTLAKDTVRQEISLQDNMEMM